MHQALRARDYPVIDAAVLLGNQLGLPMLVYHGLREDYPFASDRLHRFILGASRDVVIGCERRGLACVKFVDRAAKREKGLVYRLAAEAAAVVQEHQLVSIAQSQAERVAEKTGTALFAMNAARLLPPAALDHGVGTTSALGHRHGKARGDWAAWVDGRPDVETYTRPLAYEPDRLAGATDAELDPLVASLQTGHELPPSTMLPGSRVD